MADHLGNKLGIIKKELPEDKPHHGSNMDDAQSMIGRALNDLASMACTGFQSWQQSMLLEHASKSVKHWLADTSLMKEIKCMEEESLENDAMDVLMQMPGAISGYSCTSSLSLPE